MKPLKSGRPVEKKKKTNNYALHLSLGVLFPALYIAFIHMATYYSKDAYLKLKSIKYERPFWVDNAIFYFY
jgi:hypothetical protein